MCKAERSTLNSVLCSLDSRTLGCARAGGGEADVSEQGEQRDYASGLGASRGPHDRWLSVYEAAAMVLQHPDTVRRWISDGLVRGEVRGRLGLRIPESEVERYLASNFIADKRNPANHALSSNVITSGATQHGASEADNRGAGWPFNHRIEETGATDPAGADAPHALVQVRALDQAEPS